MGIHTHLESFAGFKVVEYNPEAGFKAGLPGTVVYRLREEYDGEHSVPELLASYLAEEGANQTTALVIGPWDSDDMIDPHGNRDVVEALATASNQLPALRAIFLGDITSQNCEISWIHQGDVSPLLTGYPRLEEFRVRGIDGLSFGQFRHDHLRILAVESGGLPVEILEEIWSAHLPSLVHLELWLGTPDYGGIEDVDALEPLLSGRLFPTLRYLGLRNSENADALAQAVAGSPLLERVQILDLSLGNLTDDGAKALLASPAVRRLEKLDIHHHFVSPEVVAELLALGNVVDASEPQQPYTWTHGGVTHIDRYNAHSE